MLAAALRLVHAGDITLAGPAQGDVDAPGRAARPARRHAAPRQLRPTSWCLIPMRRGCSIRADLKSKCKNTPFDEARLHGRVVRTIVAGRTVYEYI